MSGTSGKIWGYPIWAYVFIVTLIFYAVNLAPTVMWGDSAGFALMVHDFSLDPAADGHPLYIVLGKIFSLLPGELAVKLNFMSAFFGALAVMLTYRIVEELTGESIPAAMAAVALTLAHAFWQHAVLTEVYTINCFFLGLIVWLLLKWKADITQDRYLYWMALVFGLAISHHLILGLAGVSGLYFVIAYGGKRLLNWKRLLILIGLLLLGSSIYWIVLIKWLYFLPQKTSEVLDIVTGRGHKQFLFSFFLVLLIKNLGLYLAYLFYQFPVLGFVLGIYGWFKLMQRERRLGIFFCLLIAVNDLLFLGGSYMIWNTNYTFFIQDYLIFSIFIGFGCYCLLKRFTHREMLGKESLALLVALFLAPVFTYQATPVLVNALGIRLFNARPLPYRNNEKYFLTPSKMSYYGPRQYAQAAFLNMDPQAVLIADYTPGIVIEYFQRVNGERPDIKLVYIMDIVKGSSPDTDLKPYVDEHYGKAPLYLADLVKHSYYYNVENLEKEYSLQPQGPVYKIVKINPPQNTESRSQHPG